MLAKLHFDAGWTLADVLPIINSILGGNVNVGSVPGATAKFVPSKSYVLTSKSQSGWQLEFANTTTSVFSAPCKDSAKRKYLRLNATNLINGAGVRLDFDVVEAGQINLTTGAFVDYAGTTSIAPYSSILYTGTANGFAHNYNLAMELWIAASPRYALFAANAPGYQHGTLGGVTAGGWVTGCLEHTPSDSWINESSPYIPACAMWAYATTSNGGQMRFYRNRSRNIAVGAATDISAPATNYLEIYTKYGSGSLSTATLNGTNLVMLNENNAVRTLLPFGVRSKTDRVRGGSVTDVCDIYLAASGLFDSNLQVQVGENVNNVYHTFNIGYVSNPNGGYCMLVPRG